MMNTQACHTFQAKARTGSAMGHVPCVYSAFHKAFL